MNTGVCIQVGLCNNAEYFYLTEPDWKDLLIRQQPQWQPHRKVVDKIDDWEYYGIEQNRFQLLRWLRSSDLRGIG